MKRPFNCIDVFYNEGPSRNSFNDKTECFSSIRRNIRNTDNQEVAWYNLPFRFNIVSSFLNIVSKYFLSSHKLFKV